MAKQGRVLETMAINELDRRRKRLEEYQIKARFALAESYDRATKAQLDEEIVEHNKLQEKQQGTSDSKPAVQDNEPEQINEVPEVPENTSDNDEVTETRSSFKEKLLSK